MREEKRRVPRVPVSMKVDSSEGRPVGFGYALNISEKGLGVDAQAMIEQKAPRPGSQLEMRFMLPRSQTVITVVGRIVRVEKEDTPAPFLAMEFVDLNHEVRQEIARFVKSQPKQT